MPTNCTAVNRENAPLRELSSEVLSTIMNLIARSNNTLEMLAGCGDNVSKICDEERMPDDLYNLLLASVGKVRELENKLERIQSMI